MIFYLVRTNGGFYGHDTVTGNITLDGAEHEAQSWTVAGDAERIARAVGGYVVKR